MRTVTRRFKVYKYDELSDKAKEVARYNYESIGEGCDWFRADEYLSSIKALASHFGGSVGRYELDWSDGSAYSFMNFSMPELDVKEIRFRLSSLGAYNRRTLKGLGDCKLTGMGTDESAIDGFRIAFVRSRVHNLDDLMQAAFASWIKDAQADYSYDFSDEGLKETFDANGYEFNEGGGIYLEVE